MDAHADAGLSEPVAPATAARAARAAGLCTVALAGLLVAGLSMVLAGLSLVLGERVDRAADAGGGYELTVDYPGRTRGGLTQDIDILIRQAGGFDGPVTVALSTDYLRVFEQQGLLPEPSSATAGPERVEWTFDPPAGDALRIVIDVRVEPHRHGGETGRLSVLDGGAEPVAVELETAVMP